MVTKVPMGNKPIIRRSFVPKDGGKFYEFVSEKGAATVTGKGGKGTE